MNPVIEPVALVTGGSAGLGRAVAAALLEAGYRVAIVGRDESRLEQTARSLACEDDRLVTLRADVSVPAEIARAVQVIDGQFHRLDVLVNCVGESDRGLAESLDLERLDDLIVKNVGTALLSAQHCLPLLRQNRGVIVNIGSLAAKVGARYLGGYPAAKHALAGLTQQMRLELKSEGVHVALVSPGPIRRDDAGTRYRTRVNDERLPRQAAAPGGGTRVRGLPPERVAQAVLRCVRRRCPDVVLPGYLRILIAIGHAFPRCGDWLLLKFTSGRHPD